MKKILLFIAFLTVTISSWAGSHESSVCWVNGFGFSISSSSNLTMKVADCSRSGDVTIPTTVDYNGKTWTVITIAKYCFENKDGITSLTIPKTIKWIDKCAFDDCDKLVKVTFEDGSDDINVNFSDGTFFDNEIFYSCDKLSEVYLGRTIVPVDDSEEKPFEDVSTLTKLTIGPLVKKIPAYLCKDSGLKTLDMSNATSLTEIGKEAFENLDNLTNVDFSGCTSLTVIRNNAFEDADNLEIADMSGCTALKTLEKEAFFDCGSLATVKFPPSITYIGADCFDCNGLYDSLVTNVYFYGDDNSSSTTVTNADVDNFNEVTYVYLDRTVYNSNSSSIPFERCESVSFGNHITQVKWGMFNGDTNLKEVTIMSSQKIEICGSAFDDCSALTSLTVLTSAKIDMLAFWNCDNLNQVFVSDNTEIDDHAFSSKNIKNIYVNYNYKHDQPIILNAFVRVTSTAKVIMCGTYDASNDYPWNQFANKEVISTTKLAIDNTSTSAIASDAANAVSMPIADEDVSTFTITLPFPVSTYYFGADATIYSLDEWTDGTADTGEQDMRLTKIDLDASYTLPVNKPLLVITSHADNNVQATIDLFTTKQISVLSEDYSKEHTIGSDIYTTTSHNYKAARPFDDRNVYVVDDGYLKRVNSADYQLSAFAVSMAAPETNSDISLHLVDDASTTREQIIPSSASTTPSQYLEGYVTFYNTTSDFEISEGESGNPSGAVYTVISTSGDDKLQLHRVSDGIIDKGQAVLIKAKAGEKLTLRMVTNGSSDTEAYEENILKGVNVDTPVTDLCTDGSSYVYVLSCDASYQNPGFYRFSTGNTLGAYKAYILASALSNAGSAKAFALPVETAIKNIYTDNVNTGVYDIGGRLVSEIKKNNIYIIDNKKIIIR